MQKPRGASISVDEGSGGARHVRRRNLHRSDAHHGKVLTSIAIRTTRAIECETRSPRHIPTEKSREVKGSLHFILNNCKIH